MPQRTSQGLDRDRQLERDLRVTALVLDTGKSASAACKIARLIRLFGAYIPT